MRVRYDEVLKQIANAEVGKMTEVLVANGTRRNGSSPYYHRKGILISKTDTAVVLEIGKKKYRIFVDRDGHWENDEWVKTEYAHNLYSVQQ